MSSAILDSIPVEDEYEDARRFPGQVKNKEAKEEKEVLEPN